MLPPMVGQQRKLFTSRLAKMATNGTFFAFLVGTNPDKLTLKLQKVCRPSHVGTCRRLY